MIPVVCNMWSNANGVVLRYRLFDLINNKAKYDEANRFLIQISNDKPLLFEDWDQITISTIEELKILEELSTYILNSKIKVIVSLFIYRSQKENILILLHFKLK